MNYTCTFCGRSYVRIGNFQNHKQICQPMKYQQLEKENQKQAQEIERLRAKLENGQTINYNNCTFNVIATKDAIDTIHDAFHYFLKEATPFIKIHAKDEDLQQKLIAWGKENNDPRIQKVVTDVIENKLPFDKVSLVQGQLENPQEVEQGYLKEKESLVTQLNEIVDIENLPEYEEDQDEEYDEDDIDRLIKEAEELLN